MTLVVIVCGVNNCGVWCVCAVISVNMAAAIVQTMWVPAARSTLESFFGDVSSVNVIAQILLAFAHFLTAITFNMAVGGK